jgi:hypothetical protein
VRRNIKAARKKSIHILLLVGKRIDNRLLMQSVKSGTHSKSFASSVIYLGLG